MEAMRLAHQAILPRFNIAYEDFAKAMKDYRVIPVQGGAVFVNRNEVHVASVAKGKWISRRLIREVLGGIIKEYGEALTRVLATHEAGRCFVERLGFEHVGTVHGVSHYVLREVRH